MDLPDVFDDPLRHVPFRLEGLHGASRLLHDLLEARELREHVIDHGLLFADAVERDLHVSEEVGDRVRLALDLVHDLTSTLDGHDLLLRAGEAVAEPLELVPAWSISARRSAMAARSAWLLCPSA